ncbi:MAG: hypothetical protein V3W43_15970 [Desulfatiglandaceae bacterium]|jgi:hypothetical protein
MTETIIVLVIVGGALAIAARWVYQRLSGRAANCCGGGGGNTSSPCSSCDLTAGGSPSDKSK